MEMHRTFDVSAARLAQETMSDDSEAFGVDLWAQGDNACGYVHVPCNDRESARDLLDALQACGAIAKPAPIKRRPHQ